MEEENKPMRIEYSLESYKMKMCNSNVLGVLGSRKAS